MEYSEKQKRQNKITMKECIAGLGVYASLKSIHDHNKSEADKVRDLISDLVPYWGLDIGDDSKSVDEYLQAFDDKVAEDTRLGWVDDDDFTACYNTLTGLAQYGEDLVGTQGSDAMKDILKVADLLKDVGEHFGYHQERTFADGSAQWLTNTVKGMLNEYSLPGSAVEGLVNANYTIKQAILYDSDAGFAFAHNPNAASPYVTWSMGNNDKDELNFEIGSYFQTEEKALVDYIVRAERYAMQFNVKEKEIPLPPQEDEWRMYKAEIEMPDMEYPHFEVFHAENDVRAVEHANELCSEGENLTLLEVHELNENYDIIREIDLRFHDPEARRFMDVDIIDFLGKIADKTILHYPKDFKIDVEQIWKEAIKENPSVERLMWHCSFYGTHLMDEAETFIIGTGAYNYWTDYRPNEPSMVGFVIEITGCKGDAVVGNVFDLGNYANHAQYVRENSLVMDSVSLTYANTWGINAGKTVTVPKKEYDKDRHRLMSESGDVMKIKYHASESVQTMADLLEKEKSNHMAMPDGEEQEYLQKLTAKLAALRGEVEPPKDENRIYHADYIEPDNEHRGEIIVAKNDEEAIRLAKEFCNETDGLILTDLAEMDEDGNAREVALPQQAERFMPDPTITTADRDAYGYDYDGMLPLNQDSALNLYMQDNEIFLLFNDGSEAAVGDSSQIVEHKGIFGIEREAWQKSDARAEMKSEAEQTKTAPIVPTNAQAVTVTAQDKPEPQGQPPKKKNPYHDSR